MKSQPNTTKPKDWDKQILKNPDGGNVFQSAEFGKLKAYSGWRMLQLQTGGVAVTVVEKYLHGLGKLWYLPKGPGITNTVELKKVLQDLKQTAKSSGVFAIKVEPELTKTKNNKKKLRSLGLVPTAPVQPNFSTITLDLSPKLEDIMSGLNQKGRHAIRRAERDGVKAHAVAATDINCRKMYKLFSTTAEGRFAVRSYEYHKEFWQSFEKAGIGQMFFAYYEGKIVAAAYAFTFGKKSTYKDGASIRLKTAYGASHLLQWEVIKWAKSRGSTWHDLCGAPPSDQINNPDHPHYGIGRFKTSFNKQVTDYVGAYDLPIRPLSYKLWQKVCQKIALRLNWMLKHESWY